mmetsp:Transcript_700/g.1240  ORF Transcript_700/g.1240 Transcript_700/m.1240 type:complete len:162 (-) Transcript_700:198-683(-)
MLDAGLATTFPLTNLPDGLLTEVFSRLESDDLARCSSVCKKWANLCEGVFSKYCTARGWVIPRHGFPWRALYCRRACYACLKLGQYPVRGSAGASRAAPLLFMICKKCLFSSRIEDRIKDKTLFIDAVGVDGKTLAKFDGEGRPIKRAKRKMMRNETSGRQ